MPMPNVMTIDHCGHLAPDCKFSRQTLCGKDRYLRLREIVQNLARHFRERTRIVILQNEYRVIRSDLLDLCLQSRGNVTRRFVGDDGDALVRLESKTNAKRIACARRKLGVNC